MPLAHITSSPFLASTTSARHVLVPHHHVADREPRLHQLLHAAARPSSGTSSSVGVPMVSPTFVRSQGNFGIVMGKAEGLSSVIWRPLGWPILGFWLRDQQNVVSTLEPKKRSLCFEKSPRGRHRICGKMDAPTPIMYHQTRPGRDERGGEVRLHLRPQPAAPHVRRGNIG